MRRGREIICPLCLFWDFVVFVVPSSMQCKRSRKFILLNISDHVIPHTHTPHTHTHPALTFNNKDSVGELRSKKQRDEDTGQCTASFYGKTFIGSGIRRFRLKCRVANVSAGTDPDPDPNPNPNPNSYRLCPFECLCRRVSVLGE